MTTRNKARKVVGKVSTIKTNRTGLNLAKHQPEDTKDAQTAHNKKWEKFAGKTTYKPKGEGVAAKPARRKADSKKIAKKGAKK